MENIKLLCDYEAGTTVFEGEGGSYYAWNNTIFPALGEVKVSAGKLILKPRGFALPHYSDSNKIGFVIKGANGMAGIIYPNSSENHQKVVNLTKGDIIEVPSGSISWWFNNGVDDENELEIIFLGETLLSLKPDYFTYGFLVGTQGIFRGLSIDSLMKAYKLDEKQAKKLTNAQTGILIVKLDDEADMQIPCKNIDGIDVKDLVKVENGGSFTSFINKEVKFSGYKLVLEKNAMFGPLYYAGNSGVQLCYVAKGSGRVEVVAIEGKSALDGKVKAGQLFVVPRFYAVAMTASEEGLECLSIVTSSEPMLGHLCGKLSFWNALPIQVLQASLKVNSEFVESFKANLQKTTIISPP